MFILQLHLEHRVGQWLDDGRHHLNRLFFGHPLAPAIAARSADDEPRRPRPRTTAPWGWIATVYSKCAEALLSRVRTVQPSRSTETSARPRLNIGSIARTIPLFNTAP